LLVYKRKMLYKGVNGN